jgi:AcrR family transcriptional regulator
MEAEPVDGRTARRFRNRDAVLDAVLELFAEGTLRPAAAQVAARSGVSLRSVYRYFEDTDSLLRAAIERNVERFEPLRRVEGLGEGPLEHRIDRMVAARVRLFREAAPIARASLRLEARNPVIREQLRHNLVVLREQIEAMFAPELDSMDTTARDEVAAALDVLLGFQTMEHLSVGRGLDEGSAERVLTRAVSSMLGTTT